MRRGTDSDLAGWLVVLVTAGLLFLPLAGHRAGVEDKTRPGRAPGQTPEFRADAQTGPVRAQAGQPADAPAPGAPEAPHARRTPDSPADATADEAASARTQRLWATPTSRDANAAGQDAPVPAQPDQPTRSAQPPGSTGLDLVFQLPDHITVQAGQMPQPRKRVHRASPPNPEYLRWKKRRQERVAKGLPAMPRTQEGNALGFIPPEAEEANVHKGQRTFFILDGKIYFEETDYLKDLAAADSDGYEETEEEQAPTDGDGDDGDGFDGQDEPTPEELFYSASYDTRSTCCTQVKNQNPFGTCWSFAGTAALEHYIEQAESVTFNFSEKNLANLHGFNTTIPGGGNHKMTSAYMLRWDGPVLETGDPYPGTDLVQTGDGWGTAGDSPTGLARQRQVVEIIEPDGSNPDNIKAAIVSYGACQTSIYYADNYMNFGTDTYCYTGGGDTNHAVLIVGWDDDHSAANHANMTGPGAWLVKNSWGASWAGDGYFWVAYDDALVGSYCMAYKNVEDRDTYSHLYSYNEFAHTSSLSATYGANIYMPTGSPPQPLVGVGLYTNAANTTISLRIHTNADAGPGNWSDPSPVTIDNVTYANEGWHYVDLGTEVALTEGQSFAILVKYSSGYDYPLPMERPTEKQSATAAAGQSFCSGNGSSWSDLTQIGYANTNCMINAYAKGEPSVVAPSLSKPADGSTFAYFAPVFQWSAVDGAQYQLEITKVGAGVVHDQAYAKATSKRVDLSASGAGDYTWRMRSYDPDEDVYSDWTGTRSFTLGMVPTGLGPADGSSFGSRAVRFAWHYTPGVRWHLQIDKDGTGTVYDELVYTTGTKVELASDGDFTWRIRTYDPRTDTYGEWSDTRSFSVSVDPPALRGPGDGTTFKNVFLVKFAWYYQPGVQWRLEIQKGAATVYDEYVGTVGTTVDLSSEGTGDYTWRLCTRDKATGQESGWSASRSFTIADDPPAVRGPADGRHFTSSTVRFAWYYQPGVRWNLEIKQGAATVYDELVGTVGCKVTLATSGAHTWRLRTYNPKTGHYSPWTTARGFTVP